MMTGSVHAETNGWGREAVTWKVAMQVLESLHDSKLDKTTKRWQEVKLTTGW
jgi:hypothetical protein